MIRKSCFFYIMSNRENSHILCLIEFMNKIIDFNLTTRIKHACGFI